MTHSLYVWCGNRWDQEFEIIGAKQIDKQTTLDAWGHTGHVPTKFLDTLRTKVHRIGAMNHTHIFFFFFSDMLIIVIIVEK